MKLALVATDFINGNIQYNVDKIFIKAQEAKNKGSDMVCFGEAFLQGFDSLIWNYEYDKEMAISINDKVIKDICDFARNIEIAICFGFYQKEKNNIYSTYLLIDKQGVISDEYRRVTSGWKPQGFKSNNYKEGYLVYCVNYLGLSICNVLCGDLWDDDILDKVNSLHPSLVLWPVYVNYTKDEWKTEEKEYLRRMSKLKTRVAMINSLTYIDSSKKIMSACGGCLYINKTINSKQKLQYEKDDILFIDIS